MLQMMMGGSIYETDKFKQAMDSNYYPLDNMKKSVATLQNSNNIDVATMEFGQYQPILAPTEINPSGPKFWLKNVGNARVQLTAQANTKPLSKDQPDVVPLTKCALLDASVRKCFNSDPPICMQVNVIAEGEGCSRPISARHPAGVGVRNRKQRSNASEFDDGVSLRRQQNLMTGSLMRFRGSAQRFASSARGRGARLDASRSTRVHQSSASLRGAALSPIAIWQSPRRTFGDRAA